MLCPAKNMKALKAALPNADAIYFGVREFNLRMAGENFTLSGMKKAIKTCHDWGIKAYLTTNILVYENELKKLRELLVEAKAAEVDAVIVHDLATISMARELQLPFHISTQCNVSNSMAARFFESLGAKRVNLARECSLAQIKEIKSKLSKMEVEIFVHGAMCSAVSGRCYLSQTIAGTAEKSANRGLCTQPCRREWRVFDNEGNEFLYDGVRFMNSRDLCMVSYIPELMETGADAFKIEGRMRDPYYVHVVSSIYREALDSYYNGNFSEKKAKKWRRELKKVYNRGITTGFYFGRPTEKDHQHKSATNLSHFRLIKLGTIISHDSRTGEATVRLTNGHLHRDMPVVIMGNEKSDTFFTQRISEMRLNGANVIRTPSADDDSPIIVKLKLIKPASPDGNDALYYFTDRTYKHRIAFKRKKKVKQPQKKDFYKLK
ncbi:MAG: peptidase U32 family protein [Candidatus Helarchaeales archaeon]